MPPPRPPYRRQPVDHVASALMGLESAKEALDRINVAGLSSAQRAAVAELRRTVGEAMLASAGAIESLLDGRLRAPKPTDGRGTPPASRS